MKPVREETIAKRGAQWSDAGELPRAREVVRNAKVLLRALKRDGYHDRAEARLERSVVAYDRYMAGQRLVAGVVVTGVALKPRRKVKP